MNFEFFWFVNSLSFFNIQLVLCKINLWSCCKCFLTSRFRLNQIVSSNDDKDVKKIMMSNFTKYVMLYLLTRDIKSRRSIIVKYLAWKSDWVVFVQKTADRLIDDKFFKAEFRTKLIWSFQIVVSHNEKIFEHFFVINNARICGSLCNDLIVFVIFNRWASTKLQKTINSEKILHKNEFISSKLQFKIIQLLKQSNKFL